MTIYLLSGYKHLRLNVRHFLKIAFYGKLYYIQQLYSLRSH